MARHPGPDRKEADPKAFRRMTGWFFALRARAAYLGNPSQIMQPSGSSTCGTCWYLYHHPYPPLRCLLPCRLMAASAPAINCAPGRCGKEKMPGRCGLGIGRKVFTLLRQRHVATGGNGTEGRSQCRGGVRSNRIDVVGFPNNRSWHRIALEEIRQIRRRRLGAIARSVLERPGILGFLNDAKIVDDRVELAGVSSLDESRRGNTCQETNDGHHDHDFHEREAASPTGFYVHRFFRFIQLRGVNHAAGG